MLNRCWAHLVGDCVVTERPLCRCLEPENQKRRGWRELPLHTEPQGTGSDAWKRLLDLIERAAEDGREILTPAELGREDWWQILTLPPSITKLKEVKKLELYGSAGSNSARDWRDGLVGELRPIHLVSAALAPL